MTVAWRICARLSRFHREGVEVRSSADPEGKGTEGAALEVAVLIEADWLPLVDEVWLVTASPETSRKRLMERNGLTAAEAESRLRAQLPNEKRRSYADVEIENDGSLEELRAAGSAEE